MKKESTITVSPKIPKKKLSRSDAQIVKKLASLPQIWDIDYIYQSFKDIKSKRDQNNHSNLNKEEGDASTLDSPSYQPYGTSYSYEDAQDLLELAGFKQIISTKSFEVDGKHIKLRSDKPRHFSTYAHPLGVLANIDSYSNDKFGQPGLNSIHIYSQIDIGMGYVSSFGAYQIESSSSSYDLQKHGGNRRMSSFTCNDRSLSDIKKHLDQLQRAGVLCTFDKWDTTQFISSLLPHDIININEDNYLDFISDPTPDNYKSIAQDAIKAAENLFWLEDNTKIKGLADVLSSCFISNLDFLDDKDIYGKVLKNIMEAKYPQQVKYLEDHQVRYHNYPSNYTPSYIKNTLNWRVIEPALKSINKMSCWSNVRFFNSKDIELCSLWMDAIQTTSKQSHGDDFVVDYAVNNIDIQTLKSIRYDEVIEGGITFPHLLLPQWMRDVNAYNLLLQIIAIAPKDLVKNWCTQLDASGKTLPMNMLDNLLRRKVHYRDEDSKSFIDEFKFLSKFLCDKVGVDNIILSSDKFTPNGIWLDSFANASDKRSYGYIAMPLSSLEDVLSVFKKEGAYIDDRWILSKSLRNEYVVGEVYKCQTVCNPIHLKGDSLEDILDLIPELKDNPLILNAVMKEAFGDIIKLKADTTHSPKKNKI